MYDQFSHAEWYSWKHNNSSTRSLPKFRLGMKMKTGVVTEIEGNLEWKLKEVSNEKRLI